MLLPFIHFNFCEVGTDVPSFLSSFNNLSPLFFLGLSAKDLSVFQWTMYHVYNLSMMGRQKQ